MKIASPDPQRLLQLFETHFQLAPEELAPNAAIFSAGLLDSFHLIELMSTLEQEFGIRVTPGELTLEHFDTLERIEAFLRTKTQSPP